MKRKFFAIIISAVFLITNSSKVYSQTDGSSSSGSGSISSEPSVSDQAKQIIQDLTTLQAKLQKKKDKKSRTDARRIKLLIKKLSRSVQAASDSVCLDRLKAAMNDFFGLVADLNVGLSCGPVIIPPYFAKAVSPLITDCIIPDQLDSTFIELNPIYDSARDLIRIDKNDNSIPDVCEANIS